MMDVGSGLAAPETKAYGRGGDGLMEAFEAFKDANDERLSQIEAKLSADAVTVEKVERINRALTEQKAALDRMALDLRRPHGGSPREPVKDERGEAFNAYVRKVLCNLVGPGKCASIRLYIVRTPDFNASMAVNGAMVVYSGLLLRTQNEA